MKKEIKCITCKSKFITKVIYKDSRVYTSKNQRNFYCILRWNKVQYKKCQLCRNNSKISKNIVDYLNKAMFS